MHGALAALALTLSHMPLNSFCVHFFNDDGDADDGDGDGDDDDGDDDDDHFHFISLHTAL